MIDSGTSLLVGPKEIVDPLINGIAVKSDCSNKAAQPTLTFTIDTQDYTLAPDDYILELKGQCLLGI